MDGRFSGTDIMKTAEAPRNRVFGDFSRRHEIGAPRLYRKNRYIEAALCKSILIASNCLGLFRKLQDDSRTSAPQKIQSFQIGRKIDSKKRISTPSLQKLQYLLVPKFGPISFVPLGLSSCRNLSLHLWLVQSRKWRERDFSLHFSLFCSTSSYFGAVLTFDATSVSLLFRKMDVTVH